MNLQSINTDIQTLDKAIKLIEKTENYLHFNKSHLIFEICEQVNILRDKRDRQIDSLRKLQAQ